MKNELLEQINQLSEAEKIALTQQIERFIFESKIDINNAESDSKNQN